jgi:hypothetical protein
VEVVPPDKESLPKVALNTALAGMLGDFESLRGAGSELVEKSIVLLPFDSHLAK